MKKNLQTPFQTRQYMLSKDFELYYYHDTSLKKVATHTHNYYEFYFFLEGNVRIQIGEYTYPLTYGDFILIPPQIPHRTIIQNSDLPYRRFVFWISQEFCNHLLEISTNYGYLMQHVLTFKNYIFHNDRITFQSIQSRLIRLIEEMQGNLFCREAMISLGVNELLLHLNRLIYEQNHPKHLLETAGLYQNIIFFIDEHIDEDLSLDRLSKEFFVSKYHIAHIFKDNLGLSIHQYITKKRLTLCRQAILSDMSITETYQTFGFGDYSSFYRAFKREYGISPKDFRDMNYIREKE